MDLGQKTFIGVCVTVVLVLLVIGLPDRGLQLPSLFLRSGTVQGALCNSLLCHKPVQICIALDHMFRDMQEISLYAHILYGRLIQKGMLLSHKHSAKIHEWCHASPCKTDDPWIGLQNQPSLLL